MQHNPNIFYQSSCTDRTFDNYLLLGGGTDINPNIYEEEDFGYCQSPDIKRDTRNIIAINKAVAEGKPIFGICRGMQLLDAVFGGKLIQHTVGHPRGVTVWVSEDKRLPETSINNCSNCHHQVVNHIYTKGKIIGWSTYEYRAYFGVDSNDVKSQSFVPQIIYWPEKKALAVQFHPEWHKPSHPMNVYLRGLIKETLGLENVL